MGSPHLVLLHFSPLLSCFPAGDWWKKGICALQTSLLCLRFSCFVPSSSQQHGESPRKDTDPGGDPVGISTRLRKREDEAHGEKAAALPSQPWSQQLIPAGASPALPLGTAPQSNRMALGVSRVGKWGNSLCGTECRTSLKCMEMWEHPGWSSLGGGGMGQEQPGWHRNVGIEQEQPEWNRNEGAS